MKVVAESFRLTLAKACTAMSVMLTPEQLDKYTRYYQLLIEWNSRVNLTSVTSGFDAALKLFADSLSVLPFIGTGKTLLDIGSGGGFPGLVIKIARPELTVHLVDSKRKKVNFQKQVIHELGLHQTASYCIRLHDKKKIEEITGLGKYEVIVARAVGSINSIAGWSFPFLETGGVVLVMKGPNYAQELPLEKSGEFKISSIDRYHLPLSGHERNIITLTQGNERERRGWTVME